MKNILYASSEWCKCTASPEPSLIAQKRDIDEGSGQIVYTSYVI